MIHLRKVVALRLDVGLQTQDLGIRIGSGGSQNDGEESGEDDGNCALHVFLFVLANLAKDSMGTCDRTASQRYLICDVYGPVPAFI